jgi:hypothetical protein
MPVKLIVKSQNKAEKSRKAWNPARKSRETDRTASYRFRVLKLQSIPVDAGLSFNFFTKVDGGILKDGQV